MKYCPTDMLIADFYTKPLQGRQFTLFRNIILNLGDEQTTNFTEKMRMILKKTC